jgi:hypothetical protein
MNQVGWYITQITQRRDGWDWGYEQACGNQLLEKRCFLMRDKVYDEERREENDRRKERGEEVTLNMYGAGSFKILVHTYKTTHHIS